MPADDPIRPLPPQRPGAPEPKRDRGSLVPLAVVLTAGMGFVLVVIGCAGPAGLYALAAIAAVLGFAGLHYLLWGVWLARRIRADEQTGSGQNGADG